MGFGEWEKLAPEPRRSWSAWKMVRQGKSDVSAKIDKEGRIELSLHTHGGMCAGPLTPKQARDLGERLVRLSRRGGRQ